MNASNPYSSYTGQTESHSSIPPDTSFFEEENGNVPEYNKIIGILRILICITLPLLIIFLCTYFYISPEITAPLPSGARLENRMDVTRTGLNVLLSSLNDSTNGTWRKILLSTDSAKQFHVIGEHPFKEAGIAVLSIAPDEETIFAGDSLGNCYVRYKDSDKMEPLIFKNKKNFKKLNGITHREDSSFSYLYGKGTAIIIIDHNTRIIAEVKQPSDVEVLSLAFSGSGDSRLVKALVRSGRTNATLVLESKALNTLFSTYEEQLRQIPYRSKGSAKR